jgi:hypothetical protein
MKKSWAHPLAYAKLRYLDKKYSAKKYNIPFLISFEEYYQLFLKAGIDKNIPQKNNGQAMCLCRKGDIGPYSVDNCYIATASQNHIDAHINGRMERPEVKKAKPIMTPFGKFDNQTAAINTLKTSLRKIKQLIVNKPTEYYYL